MRPLLNGQVSCASVYDRMSYIVHIQMVLTQILQFHLSFSDLHRNTRMFYVLLRITNVQVNSLE